MSVKLPQCIIWWHITYPKHYDINLSDFQSICGIQIFIVALYLDNQDVSNLKLTISTQYSAFHYLCNSVFNNIFNNIVFKNDINVMPGFKKICIHKSNKN